MYVGNIIELKGLYTFAPPLKKILSTKNILVPPCLFPFRSLCSFYFNWRENRRKSIILLFSLK